ncbi:MAG TPA: FHA domain-containing protein, partial [Ktedonobacterales bacterium]
VGADEVMADPTSARVIIRSLSTQADGSEDAPAQRVGEYALEGRTITIGRTQDCDIVFDGDTLTSRRHAILRCEEDHYTVADLGSSNGTFLNDLEITEPTPLHHGDRLLIGQHELLFLLAQPQAIAPSESQPISVGDADDAAILAAHGPQPENDPSASEQEGQQAGEQADRQTRPTGAPAEATAKHASVARLSSELAASASRMVAPVRDGAELDAIRTRLVEASEALTRQARVQTALAERRRAAIIEARERLTDLIADLRGNDPEEISPVQHLTQPSLQELVSGIANDPENLDRLRTLASRADELAQALRAQGPTEGQWSYERAHILRGLDDIRYLLQQQS